MKVLKIISLAVILSIISLPLIFVCHALNWISFTTFGYAFLYLLILFAIESLATYFSFKHKTVTCPICGSHNIKIIESNLIDPYPAIWEFRYKCLECGHVWKE